MAGRPPVPQRGVQDFPGPPGTEFVDARICPEEIHASMTAASNADDPRCVNRAAMEARERTDAVSHDGTTAAVALCCTTR